MDLRAIVVAAFAVQVASNVASFLGVFGGDIGSISQEEPTYVTPDGITFVIWGVIYTLQLALTVAQCIAGEDAEQLLSQRCLVTGLVVRWRIIAVFLLNAIWLPVFSARLFTLSSVVIVAYLMALISVYAALNTRETKDIYQVILYAAPIASNASWLLNATAANLFVAAGQFGFRDTFGVNGSVPAALLVVTVLVTLASHLAACASDTVWGATAAWALAGLYRAQTLEDPDSFPVQALSPTLAFGAKLGVVVVIMAFFVGLGFAVYRAYEPPPEVQHVLVPTGRLPGKDHLRDGYDKRQCRSCML